MKNLIQNTVTLLLVTLLISILPTEAEGEIYDDTIRLHILANSDNAEDQKLKIAVRDYILSEYGERLHSCVEIGEAKEKITELIPVIEASVKNKLDEWGYSYRIRAVIGQEWYDTREYEDFTLPAGSYCSLRILIGEGRGQNWWCVMYPPLCLEMATESAPADDGVIDYTKEEILLIKSSKYNVKFKILEEVSRLFEKNG